MHNFNQSSTSVATTKKYTFQSLKCKVDQSEVDNTSEIATMDVNLKGQTDIKWPKTESDVMSDEAPAVSSTQWMSCHIQ